MIKSKKLNVARETLVLLSTRSLEAAHAGVGTTTRSAAPVACEPSGILACPTR